MLTTTAVVGAAAAATGTSIGTMIVGIAGTITTAIGTVFTVRAAIKSNSYKKEIEKLSKFNEEQKKINSELKNNVDKLKESNNSFKELSKQHERKIDELQRLNNNHEARFRELESSSENYNRRIDKLDNSSELTTQILMQHNNLSNRNGNTYKSNESEKFSYKKTRRRSNAMLKKFGMPKLEEKDFCRNCESEYM